MGNNQSLQGQIPKLQQKKWIQADEDGTSNFFNNVNPFRKRLLMNISTHQLIQQYEINFIAEEDFNNYLKEIHYRYDGSGQNILINGTSSSTKKTQNFQQNLQKRYIYPISYFTNKSKQQMCTTVYTGYLYIQKVDLRLKQINDIPFEDQLYIYKAALQGFKILYEKVGYFDIKQQMIFINKKGQIRVWMNANLSKNYPNFEKKEQSFSFPNRSSSKNLMSYNKNQLSIYGSQSQMIKSLLELIESNSDSQLNKERNVQFFSDYLYDKNILDRMSFDYALEEFNNYIGENHFRVKPYMSSILELFSSQGNQQHIFKKNINQDEQINSQHSYVKEVLVDQVQSKFSNQSNRNHNSIPLNNPQLLPQRVLNPFNQITGVQNFTNLKNQNLGHYQSIPYQRNAKIQSNIQINSPNFNTLKDSRYSYQSQNASQHYDNNQLHHFQKLKESSLSNNLLKKQGRSNNHFNYPVISQQGNRQQTVRNAIHQNNLSHRFVQPQNFIVNQQPVFYQMSVSNLQQRNVRISKSPNPIFLNVNNLKVNHEQTPSFSKYPPPLPSRTNLICINNRPIQVLKNYPVTAITMNQINTTRINNNNSLPLQFQKKTELQKKKNNSYIQNQLKIAGGQSKLAFRKTNTMESQGIISQQNNSLQFNSNSMLQKQSIKSKSNIKYYSNNTTYELDDQIAQDLQKMLGLTVN